HSAGKSIGFLACTGPVFGQLDVFESKDISKPLKEPLLAFNRTFPGQQIPTNRSTGFRCSRIVGHNDVAHITHALPQLARGGIIQLLYTDTKTTMSSTALYTDLSGYYDLMCADINYREQCDYVRRVHQLFGNQAKGYLDLACGTGPHLRYFIDAGYTATG